MAKRTIHVVPSGNEWKVRTAGAERAVRVTSTQREAIDVARKIAQHRGTELIVHRPDGTIRSKDSFGNDPFPPRG